MSIWIWGELATVMKMLLELSPETHRSQLVCQYRSDHKEHGCWCVEAAVLSPGTSPQGSHSLPLPSYFLLQISGLPSNSNCSSKTQKWCNPLGRQEVIEKLLGTLFPFWHSSPQGPAIILSGVCRGEKIISPPPF